MAIYKSDIVNIDLDSGSIFRSFLNNTIGTADKDANRFGVRVFRSGAEVDLSGCSCYGYFRDPQGNNIALTSVGAVSGNEAYVTLPQACYNYEGQFCLAIKLIGGGVTGTVRIIDGVVDNTNTGSAVAPTSAVPTYTEILSQYDAMVAATAAANTAIAPTFAQGTAYAAGALVINDGALYALPNGHTAGTTWANTTKVATNLGDQVTSLKSAVDFVSVGHEEIDISDYSYISCVVTDTNTLIRSASKYMSRQIPMDSMWNSIKVTANNNYSTQLTFVKSALPAVPTSGTDMTSYLCTGETGRHVIPKQTSEKFTIPSDCAYIVITYKNNNNDATPAAVEVYADIGDDIYNLQKGMGDKQDKMVGREINWADEFGNDSYPLGWQKGYYSRNNGKTGASDDYIRNIRGTGYTAKKGEAKIVFTVPTGYHAQINEYNDAGEYVTYYGNDDSGAASIEAPLTETYMYKFVIGNFDGDAGDYYNDSDFIATVTATVYKTFESWQEEQDNRIKELEIGEAEIPEYYNADSYLQNRLDEITRIQNEICRTTENNETVYGNATDAFWFITDYHHQYNQGKSLALIRYLKKRTGITKMFFGGDAGGAAGSAASAVYHRIQKSANAWEEMSDCVDEFYGVLGNHEWINANTGKPSGMMSAYLNRYKTRADGMSAETGSYYVDNIANKTRYYFLQQTNAAYPSNNTVDWFGKNLLTLEDGWSAAVTMHHGYIPSSATYDEYYGVEVEYGHTTNKAISKLLAAMRDKTDITHNSIEYKFSELTGTRHVIGVFCGHIHHGFLYTEGTDSGVENIAVFRGSTDCMHAASVDKNDHPWYWKDGIVTGEDEDRIEREAGTVNEQCFYAVQIDMVNKKLYITAIGGDHDWEGYYEPPEEA